MRKRTALLILAIVASLSSLYGAQHESLSINAAGLVIAYAKSVVRAQAPHAGEILSKQLDALRGTKEFEESLRKRLSGKGSGEEQVADLLLDIQRGLKNPQIEKAADALRQPGEVKIEGLPWPLCELFDNCD